MDCLGFGTNGAISAEDPVDVRFRMHSWILHTLLLTIANRFSVDYSLSFEIMSLAGGFKSDSVSVSSRTQSATDDDRWPSNLKEGSQLHPLSVSVNMGLNSHHVVSVPLE